MTINVMMNKTIVTTKININKIITNSMIKIIIIIIDKIVKMIMEMLKRLQFINIMRDKFQTIIKIIEIIKITEMDHNNFVDQN